jgi:hypothetical protein
LYRALNTFQLGYKNQTDHVIWGRSCSHQSTYSMHDFLLITAAIAKEHVTAAATYTFAMS